MTEVMDQVPDRRDVFAFHVALAPGASRATVAARRPASRSLRPGQAPVSESDSIARIFESTIMKGIYR